MNFLKITYFLAVAETLNFTRAAEQLNISQSVLSRHILAMERELALTLFIRDSKNVALTPAGKLLYDGFYDLRRRYLSIIEKAAAVENGASGLIKIGALSGQLVQRFTPMLLGFEKQYPDIEVLLEAYNLRELRQRLGDRQLDFIFGANANFDYFPEFRFEVVARAQTCVIVSREHKYFGKKPENLTLSDFKGDVFITISKNEMPVPAKELTERCKKAGFTPKLITAGDLGTLMLWLEARRGISVLDETHVFSSNPHLSFIPLPELGCSELSVIWNEKNENPCNRSFIQHVRDYMTRFHYD